MPSQPAAVDRRGWMARWEKKPGDGQACCWARNPLSPLPASCWSMDLRGRGFARHVPRLPHKHTHDPPDAVHERSNMGVRQADSLRHRVLCEPVQPKYQARALLGHVARVKGGHVYTKINFLPATARFTLRLARPRSGTHLRRCTPALTRPSRCTPPQRASCP